MLFTGERYIGNLNNAQISYEHWHRYLFASEYVKNKKVLDIACGEGYGTHLLAHYANEIVGVDISEEAVEHARSTYKTTNSTFLVGSVNKIPITESHVFDVILSYETIEHVNATDQVLFLLEVKRLLKKDGLFIVSTPDKYYYSDLPDYKNEFHIKEFYRDEFYDFLKEYFEKTAILGQQIYTGSAILNSEWDRRNGMVPYYLNHINNRFVHDKSGQQSTYLIALCSDFDIDIQNSLLIDKSIRLVKEIDESCLKEINRNNDYHNGNIANLFIFLNDNSIVLQSTELKETDFNLSFNLKGISGIKYLRFDPTENRICRIKITSIKYRKSEKEFIEYPLIQLYSNGKLDENGVFSFETLDPMVFIHLHEPIELIIIEGMRELKPMQKIDELLNKKNEELNQKNEELNQKGEELNQKNEELKQKNEELNQKHEELNQKNKELNQKKEEINQKNEELNQKNEELNQKNEELNQIVASRSWRITKPLRYIIEIPIRIINKIKYLKTIAATAVKRNGGLKPTIKKSLRVLMEEGIRGAIIQFRKHAFYAYGVVQIIESKANMESYKPYLALSDILGIEVIDSAKITAEVDAIKKSGLFDEHFYRTLYPDLQPLNDAIKHYCEQGWHEGRNPSDDFDTRFYLATYSDIRNAGINPFWHYVVAGKSEQRQAVPDLTIRYENDIWFGAMDTDSKLLAFFSSPDWERLRSGKHSSKGNSKQLLPHEELGFYDLSDCHVLKNQAQMAKRHGFYGFCFHLSSGTNIIPSHPVELFLTHDDINFRFCLLAELQSEVISESLVAIIVRAILDKRYILVDGRPVILINVFDKNDNAVSFIRFLRRRITEQGVDNPFMICQWTQSYKESTSESLVDLFDAFLDLPSVPVPGETGDFLPMNKNGIDVVPYCVVASQGVARAQNAQLLSYPIYHLVTLGRNNIAQGETRPLVYSHFHVRDYRHWLDAAIASAKVAHPEDRRFVFINAWNNWNEELFLEPDRQGGWCRVNETTRALLGIAQGAVMPKVSVIVPNYNHERFLCRRLDSIYGQTYKNIEVILLDDCSSDQSRTLLDQYAADHPDITCILYNNENSGSAFRQWAKGIKVATGDLVWIAESDDYCDERFLEVLVRCFEDEAVLLAYSKCDFVTRDEVPMRDEFNIYLSDLECAEKWNESYVETAHNEVRTALGIKNTIPNVSGVLFKRPVDMPLLDEEFWLSMVVAGDWVFYLHIIRGGKIAYSTETTNFFRRYKGSTAEVTYKKRIFYREVGLASQTVATLYDVPLKTLEKCRKGYKTFYEKMVGQSDEEFSLWYDYESILHASENRLPNVLVSTMAFFPGGAEILPIRLANEFKRQGLSVLMLNAGLMCHEDSIRRMLRNDIPVIETSSVDDLKAIIHDFGVEVLNTHQWHIQKYPLQVPDVFNELRVHIASLHGMIEHGNAFGVTKKQLLNADQNVTTWVYTAEKNLGPFSNFGLYDKSSRFVKIPNGMKPPRIMPIPRADIGIPDNAFALCCVSRAIPDKGWAEMIMVVERARELSGRDIRLILVGNGPVYDEYCRVGTPDFIYLAGFSENSVGHYAAADMGIMLTKFKSESFPLTIVDCLFAGKPYIASDVGDIRNMLTTGEYVAGEVIELEDWEIPIEKTAQVVAAFATDKQKYINALALVPDIANLYHIDVVASQYINLFQCHHVDGQRLRSNGLLLEDSDKAFSKLNYEQYEWHMAYGERIAIISLLQKIKPEVSIEIGTFKCGSLGPIAHFSKKVYTLDLNEELKNTYSNLFPNVEFVPGDSSKTLPSLISKLNISNDAVEFILVDGDHTQKGVKKDIESCLKLIPKKTIYILFHDTFNPEVRKGISNARWENSPYVHFVELDLIQGILQQQAAIYKQMWGGIGLAILKPKKRDFELNIQKSHELLFEAAFSKSAHQE